MSRVGNHEARVGFTGRAVATKASHCISSITSTWNCIEANTNTLTIDHSQRIHLQSYYVDWSVIEWLVPAVLQWFYSPSTIICESHIWDVFHQAVHVVFSFQKNKYGMVSKREERREEKWKASLSLLLIYQTKSPGSLCAINLTRQKVWQLGALTTHLRLLTLPRIKCSQEAARNTGHSD